jgi:Flp pilus assembly protein TadD
MDNLGFSRNEWIVIPLLLAITLAVFWPVQSHRFIRHDDDAYVYENPHVNTGLTFANVGWALTAMHAYNWHPVTWISHMLDVQVYGLDPAGHHRTNLLLHLANVVMLYLALRRITGFRWRSAFVAVLFAIHPLHVEPVAWVAERKELLSTAFLLLAILAYASYVKRPCVRRYLAVCLLAALGLMSKPMLVTLPLVLLLLDYWPLCRMGSGGKILWQLTVEKLPLFFLAGASAVITLIAQWRGGAVAAVEDFPFGVRVANAALSYVRYLGKMFWPADLAVPYPHPGSDLPAWQVAGAAVLLILLTLAAVRVAAKHPYVAVGWLWYLITLFPVIGLVQVGGQAMADRYTYITLIGLFMIIAWGIPAIPGWAGRRGRGPTKSSTLFRWASVSLACVSVALLAAAARAQVSYWRDGVTLFTHTLSVTQDNYLAHNHLGVAYDDAGDPGSAIAEFRKTLALAPDFAVAYYNLGRVLMLRDKADEAIGEFKTAIRLAPSDARSYHNLGYALGKAGRMDAAMEAFRDAIRLQPQLGDSHNGLSVLLFAKGLYAEAWKEARLAEQYGVQPNPDFLKALSAMMPEPARKSP